MPRPRVYVETTIPNFYYDVRASLAVTTRRQATRRWWADAGSLYDLVTGPAVYEELAAGTKKRRVALRLKLLDGLPVLPYETAVADIVQVYVWNKLMPAHPAGDAMHLALASYHGCDFIVTWNCQHLANPNKYGHIQRINQSLGLCVPRIVTPLDLLGGAYDGPPD